MRASLPMYDLPELRAATDAWWAGIARELAAEGFADVPRELERGKPLAAVWRAPDLLLSQCCGRDLVTALAGVAVPVAIPCYRAPGCTPGRYRSWLVVRRGDPRARLEDLAGAVAAVNDTGSHSGWIALGHTLARAGLPKAGLDRGLLTGSHRASLAAVADGRADVAAIDCVTFALLARAAPELVGAVRILAESAPAPALPYVTAAGRDVRRRLLAALVRVAADPMLVEVRSALLLDGFLAPADHAFAPSRAMAAAALPWLDGLPLAA
jgi:ABC-type phosphate/phosphonate transport system substrate-binding protein